MPEKTQNIQTRVKQLSQKLKDRHLSPDRIFAAVLAALMFSYTYVLITNGNFADYQQYYLSIHFGAFFAIAIIVLLALTAATYFSKISSIIPWALLMGTVAVSVLMAANYPSSEIVPSTSYFSDPNAWISSNVSYVFFCIGIGVVDFIVIKWLVKNDKLGIANITIDRKIALIIACLLFVVATIVFGYFTSLKYRSFNNHAFDFGIFAQMYERMAVSGVPETTLERSYQMSHFGVHFSPIFYLFLPGYWIFRSPIYLFYLQSAAVAAVYSRSI